MCPNHQIISKTKGKRGRHSLQICVMTRVNVTKCHNSIVPQGHVPQGGVHAPHDSHALGKGARLWKHFPASHFWGDAGGNISLVCGVCFLKRNASGWPPSKGGQPEAPLLRRDASPSILSNNP